MEFACVMIFLLLLENFDKYVDLKYVMDCVSFKRSGKFSLECAIKYPFLNKKKSTSLDANRIIKKIHGDFNITITKQAISDRMKRINPQVYIDMNNDAITKLYHQIKGLNSFKGFHVMAIDGSIIEIPNTKITREEFKIPENTPLKKHTSTARISCMADTIQGFILSSNMTNKFTHEIEHALYHLEDAKNKIDLTHTITIYDRGYNSTEIMLKTIKEQSYFIIRAKKSTFKKQQRKNDKQ